MLVLLLLFGVGIGAMSYFQYQARQRRMRAVQALAQQIGFEFSPDDTHGILGMPFTLFRKGAGQNVSLVISGTHNSLPLRFFDYDYHTGSGKSRTDYHFTCGLLTIPAACPPLRVAHENAITRLGDHLGHHDVKLEYDDFNRHFLVNCKEQKFAFALLDGQMMQWLLDADNFDEIEMLGTWVLFATTRLEPAAWPNIGSWLDGFHAHIPPVVYTTYPRNMIS